MPTHSSSLSLAIGSLLLSAPLAAQSNWVSWVDETSTRLQLSTVPLNDTLEKDVAHGDFDRDGDEDAVIVRKVPWSTAGGAANVLLMNEGGVLIDRTVLFGGGLGIADDTRDILVFDAQGDGWPDLVTASTFLEQPRMFFNLGVDINGNWLGFVESLNWFSPLFSPGPKFCAVYDGDVDGDGDLDLYFSDYDSPLEDRLLINDGAGHFTDETTTRFPTGANNSVFGTSSFICDFNLDGFNDILKCSGSFEPLKMLYNNGSGVFPGFQLLPSTSVYMARTIDHDLDGWMDIYVVSDGQDYLLVNGGVNAQNECIWTQVNVAQSNRTLGFGGNVHIADVDRDGWPDVGVADVDVDIPGCTREFTILRNQQPNSSVLVDPENGSTRAWHENGVHDFAWMDINGDGFEDMLQGLCSGYRVYMAVPFAAAEPYGAGTGGAAGVPEIGSTTAPYLGNPNFEVTLDGAFPGGVPTLVVGTSADEIAVGGGTLLIGLPFANLVSGPAVNFLGHSSVSRSLPSNAGSEGLRAYVQWFVPDPQGGLTYQGSDYSVSRGMAIYLSSNQLP